MRRCCMNEIHGLVAVPSLSAARLHHNRAVDVSTALAPGGSVYTHSASESVSRARSKYYSER